MTGHNRIIEVKVLLKGNLKEPGTIGESTLKILKGSMIRDLLQELNLPDREVGLIFINGGLAKKTTILKEGNEVTVLPVIDGG